MQSKASKFGTTEVVDLSGVDCYTKRVTQKATTRARLADVGHQLAHHLRTKGWCFVRLPPHMMLLPEEIERLRAFFDESVHAKSAFSAPLAYGYSALADHKEGFRVLTGNRLLTRLPSAFDAWLADFARCLDDCVVTILLSCCQQVFGMKPNKLAKACDLPVAYKLESHFGMLDFAHYYNRSTHSPMVGEGISVDEVNCVPHSDPGLLSLSFFSDREGLQLKEPVLDSKGRQVGERWVDGPVNTIPGQEDIGVLWLGDAAVKATEGRLKPGIHRVKYPDEGHNEGKRDRLTGWYEVCTAAQALELGEQDEFPTSGEVVLSNLPTVPGPLPVEAGQRHYDFLRKVERVYGIPMRKSARMTDIFKSHE